MPPRRDPQHIGGLVSDLLKQAGTQHAALAGIQHRWQALVGKALAAHSRPASLRRGQLVVQVDRPGDGFALNFQRAHLLRQLQAQAGHRVEEIVIRPSRAEP